MGFSYALEFYKEGIFSLDDISTFKRKVKEAEEVDKYFSKIVPNINFVRPYILNSYKLEKKIGFKNRTRYVRGLIYASDYIDMTDINNIPNDVELFKQSGKGYLNLEKDTTWSFTGYDKKDNEEYFEDPDEDYDEDVVSDLAKENEVEIDSKIINTLSKEATESKEEKIINDNDKYISVEDKLEKFKYESKKYINETISCRLEENLITKEDVPMIKKAMRTWLNMMFNIVDRINEFNRKELEYNDKNLTKFL